MKLLSRIRNAVRQKYAWPGGYPLHLVMIDAESICLECAKKNWKHISHAARYPEYGNTWECVDVIINYEDNDLVCCQCGNHIESAYGSE